MSKKISEITDISKIIRIFAGCKDFLLYENKEENIADCPLGD
jgi:hypothetical protein